MSNSTSEADESAVPEDDDVTVHRVRIPEPMLAAFINTEAPAMRMVRQLREQNEAIVRQLAPIETAILRAESPTLRLARQLHEQNQAIVKGYELGASITWYQEMVSSLAASSVFQAAASAARLQTALGVGGHLNRLFIQDAWWKNSVLGAELADLAHSHLELTGWAAAFPGRDLLAETAEPAELWGRSVLELSEHPNLIVPVRSGRTSTALTGANLLVNLQNETEASEEAAVLVAATVLEPSEAGRIELAGELYAVLGTFDPAVPTMLRGAWHDVTVQGPAAAETTAHLVVEAIDRTLRAATPDPQVLLEWHAKNKRPAKELHDGGPTRGLRVRYLARELKEKALVIAQEDALAKLLTEVMGGSQGVKHASNGGLVIARSMLLSAESLLIQLFLRN